MKKLLFIFFIIPNLTLGNTDLTMKSTEALTKNGMSRIFAKNCSQITEVYEETKDLPDERDHLTSIFGMAMIGMITGYNYASHINNVEGGYGVETSITDPKFLFQYLINECQKNPELDIGIPMFEYINDQIQLGNTYKW